MKNDSAFSALSEKTLEDVNINLLGRVTDQVFSESEEWDIDTVSETIASEYNKATDLSLKRARARRSSHKCHIKGPNKRRKMMKALRSLLKKCF